MLVAVIMAGGAGKRFWPLSRKSNPKQFLRIASEKSMIQATVDRLLGKLKIEDIYVVTAQSQAHLVKKHLPDMPAENIISEPEGMNTAPAIALSALYLSRKYKPEDKMLILAADHVITDVEKFRESLVPAEKFSDDDNLVTFGIKPAYPATGYGYVEGGEKLEDGLSVKSFKEKPDEETAKEFLKSGNYFWNSGMFMWKLGTILDAYRQYLPKVNNLLDEISVKWNKEGTDADISNIYSKMPKIPVDIGIMEQADKRVVIPVDYGWSDIGGWKALYDISKKDKNGNVIKAETELIDVQNCYIQSEKLVALIGIKDLIIVDTPDALMITDKDRSEKIKDIVVSLEKEKRENYL